MTEYEAAEERPSKRLKTSLEDGPTGAEALEQSVVGRSEKADDPVTEKERKVGITAFVQDSRPVIRALVKKRYVDFLVNEVLPGGKVLHLRKIKPEREVVEDQDKGTDGNDAVTNGNTSTSVSTKPESSAPIPAPVVANQPVNGSAIPEGDEHISDEDRVKLISNLNEKAVTELLDLYHSILKHPKRKPKDHTIVKTEFTSDRTLRAHIHQDIRRVFNSKIESSTNHEGILVLSAASQRQESRPNKPRPKPQTWQERGGDYCHFTLYKENKDTMEAVSLLARFLKMNPKEMSFAGTKDRRAVTVQRISARRVDADRLAALNKTLRMTVVGDFEYASHEVGLGDLEGNEFTITLRDCTLSDSSDAVTPEILEQIRSHFSTGMSDLHTHGFLNYFGLQRFGTFAIRSDIVGLKILSSDYEGACNAILEYFDALVDSPSYESANQVGREDRARAQSIKLFKDTNNIKESLNLMPKRFSAESALIRHLGKKPSDFLGAILSIQHGMRTMYTHAYQSMVWNAAASHRWTLHGAHVVEGDLVLIREHLSKDPLLSSTEESSTIDTDGEPIIQASGSNRAKIANEVFERARPLSSSEAQSGAYSIFDIVLPQPGYDVLYPANSSGAFYKSFMGSETGGRLDPADMRRKQRDFSLSGAYRKVVARIGAGWSVDVREYEDRTGGEEEQFVVTDWEAIQAKSGSLKGMTRQQPVVERDTSGGVDGDVDGDGDGNGAVVGETEKKVAAILKFQLGTSQYATMALRELSAGGVREYKPDFSGGR